MRVLRMLDETSVLDGVVIVGSWSLYFYRYYFKEGEYFPDIRTRDIDFLVPLPPRFKQKVDVPAILEKLGFIIDFKGEYGYMRLDHPELIVEFLIPEVGRGRDKPYPLPQLGLNAQPLRFLNFLAENTITIQYQSLKLRLPHPAAYALHKLIIFDRRKSRDKAEKDRAQAVALLKFLAADKKRMNKVKAIFDSMHHKWQKTVLLNLKKIGESELAGLLT